MTADQADPTRQLRPTERTMLKRHPERAGYEREALHAILDEALFCHVGFATEDGPVVIPTIHVRIDDRLYIHGSPASRMLRLLGTAAPVCVTVTLVDGLVLARSAFHHSMNYRSAVVFGRAESVDELNERARVLDALVDHVVPGRRAELRDHRDKELRTTQVLSLPLTEASVKVRRGGPLDDEADMDLPVWAGVIPLGLCAGGPEPEPELDSTIDVPACVVDYQR